MKTKILRLSTIFLLLALISVSCQNDDDLFEIKIGDKNAVIEKEIDGIGFKFCLLNEQGEPATVFNKGENFTFLFTITNNGKNPLLFHDYSFYENGDFFSVSSNAKDFGRPFNQITGLPSTTEMRYIYSEESDVFRCLWQDSRERFSAMYGVFTGLNKGFLEEGKYVSRFTHNFNFGDVKTGSLTFKINFAIN